MSTSTSKGAASKGAVSAGQDRRSMSTALAAASAAAMLLACSGDPPPAVTPPPQPTVAPAPTVDPAPTADPAPTVDPSAEADAGPPKPTSSGRPPVLRSSDTEITDTFGSSPAAKLEIGEDEKAVLKIPENALERGYNITFKLDPKGKATGVAIGKIYHTMVQVAGQPDYSKVVTAGEPFQLQMPAGNKKDANLAIGEILVDERGKEKITWSVIAPTKIDDVSGTAYFDLTFLGDAYIHITTKAPTAPAAPKP
jgi:hypothetical protein